eukprot:3194004-Rhodomonas_salina.2
MREGPELPACRPRAWDAMCGTDVARLPRLWCYQLGGEALTHLLANAARQVRYQPTRVLRDVRYCHTGSSMSGPASVHAFPTRCPVLN